MKHHITFWSVIVRFVGSGPADAFPGAFIPSETHLSSSFSFPVHQQFEKDRGCRSPARCECVHPRRLSYSRLLTESTCFQVGYVDCGSGRPRHDKTLTLPRRAHPRQVSRGIPWQGRGGSLFRVVRIRMKGKF